MDGLVSVFSGKAEAKEGMREEELEKLHAKIGQLVVERNLAMSIEQRRGLIEPEHEQLSIVRQCELVSISRSSFYHRPVGETAESLTLMRLIDTQFLETPWYGSGQMARHLRRSCASALKTSGAALLRKTDGFVSGTRLPRPSIRWTGMRSAASGFGG